LCNKCAEKFLIQVSPHHPLKAWAVGEGNWVKVSLGNIRQKQIIVFITVFALSLIVLQSIVTFSSDQFAKADSTTHPWPMFRIDNTHTGTSNGTGPTTPVMQRWRFYAGPNVTSSPAVINGVVYFGSGNGSVFAVDEVTGLLKWSYTTGANVESSPAVSGGIVYVGSNDGVFYALNATTGVKIWNYTTGPIRSSPTIMGGAVYVSSITGSNTGNITSFNGTSGAVYWTRSMFQDATKITSSPAVWNNRVFVGSSINSTVETHDTGSGNLIGTYYTSGPVLSSPSIQGGNAAYFGCEDGKVYSFFSTNNTQRWSFTTGGGVQSSPSFSGSYLYVGSNDGKIYALNLANGNQVWNYSTGGSVYSSPAASTSAIYVGSDDGNLYALNQSNGSKLWTYTIGAAIKSSPAITDGAVFVGAMNGYVYALVPSPSYGESLSFSLDKPDNYSVKIDSFNCNFTYLPVLYGLDKFVSATLIIDGIVTSTTNQSAIVNNTVNGLMYSFPAVNGTHNWNVRLQNSTNSVTAASSYTFSLSVYVTNPEYISVVLNQPSSNSTKTDSFACTFTYTPLLIGTDKFVGSTLIIDGIPTPVTNQTVITNNTSNSLALTFTANGTHTWNVRLQNTTNTVTAAQNNIFTLQVYVPPSSNPPPNNGPTPTPAPLNTPTPISKQTPTPEPSQATPTPTPLITPEPTNISDFWSFASVRTVSTQEVITGAETITLAALIATFATIAATYLSDASSTAVGSLPFPDWLKEFLKKYTESKFEDKVKKYSNKPKIFAFISPKEIGVLAAAIGLSAVVVAFVKSGGIANLANFGNFFNFLFAALISAVIVQTATFLCEVYAAYATGVKKQYTLWNSGSVMFLITGFGLMFPFSSLTTTHYAEKLPEKVKGLAVLFKRLTFLSLTILFGFFAISNFENLGMIGDAGLLLVLTGVCSSLIPLHPLAGKDIYKYNKTALAAVLIPIAILLFCYKIQLFPFWVYSLIGIAALFAAPAALNRLKTQKAVEKIRQQQGDKYFKENLL
jgi:outer membrane protein assembly factor BamB